jgi:hypothetical protein
MGEYKNGKTVKNVLLIKNTVVFVTVFSKISSSI